MDLDAGGLIRAVENKDGRFFVDRDELVVYPFDVAYHFRSRIRKAASEIAQIISQREATISPSLTYWRLRFAEWLNASCKPFSRGFSGLSTYLYSFRSYTHRKSHDECLCSVFESLLAASGFVVGEIDGKTYVCGPNLLESAFDFECRNQMQLDCLRFVFNPAKAPKHILHNQTQTKPLAQPLLTSPPQPALPPETSTPGQSDLLITAWENALKIPYNSSQSLFTNFCRCLQAQNPDQPFLLPFDKIAELMSRLPSTVAAYRTRLINEALLIRCSQYRNSKSPTTYRFIDPDQSYQSSTAAPESSPKTVSPDHHLPASA